MALNIMMDIDSNICIKRYRSRKRHSDKLDPTTAISFDLVVYSIIRQGRVSSIDCNDGSPRSHLQQPYDTFGTLLGHFWDIFGTPLRHFHSVPGASLVYLHDVVTPRFRRIAKTLLSSDRLLDNDIPGYAR